MSWATVKVCPIPFTQEPCHGHERLLAIDLGRYNSVACWYAPDTRAAEFRTVQTTPDELRRVLTQQPVSSVVFEACSQAGWVHDLCEEVGLPMTVASTNGEAWQCKRFKRKTD